MRILGCDTKDETARRVVILSTPLEHESHNNGSPFRGSINIRFKIKKGLYLNLFR